MDMTQGSSRIHNSTTVIMARTVHYKDNIKYHLLNQYSA